MVSAFEGSSAVDSAGNSLFKSIRVTASDEKAIMAFFYQFTPIITSQLQSMLLAEPTTADDKITFQMKDSYASRGQHSLPDAIAEAYAMYAIYRWLADKASDRSEFYARHYQELLQATKLIAFQKVRPTLTQN
jgi:hypothetical protein